MRPWRPWRTFWRPADMTHDELLAVLRPTGLPWAYHHWEGKQAPPYGVYLDTEDDPFFADNQTYTSFRSVRLEVYSLERDPALDARVKAALDAAELSYDVDYTWIESEGLYETIFECEV